MMEQRKALSAEFWHELHIRESLLAQKSRVSWIVEGDSNTRFFHTCIKGNSRKTQLLKLKVGDRWIEDVHGIKKEVKIILNRVSKKKVSHGQYYMGRALSRSLWRIMSC